MIHEGEIQEFRAGLTNLTLDQLTKELPHHADVEWRWNSIADEINRRRKALKETANATD